MSWSASGVAAVVATALGLACGAGARSDQPPAAPEPVPDAPRPTAQVAPPGPPSPAVIAPSSVYCAVGIEPGCSCDALAALTSVPDGHTPAELAMAAERYAAVVPDAFQPARRSEVTDLPGRGRASTAKPAAPKFDAPACVAPLGGKVYCRVNVDGGTVPALPHALADIEACGRSACATLRFSLARTCPRAGGGVTAWAELAGLTELWGQAK